MMIVGIDPGYDGAVAAAWEDEEGRRKFHVWDIPTVNIKYKDTRQKTKYSTRKTYDLPGIREIFRALSTKKDVIVYIERPQAFRSGGQKMSKTSGMALSTGFGVMLGFSGAFQFECYTIPATTWKRALGLSYDKTESMGAALLQFRGADKVLTLKKHHNRAEALLIAYYGMAQEMGKLISQRRRDALEELADSWNDETIEISAGQNPIKRKRGRPPQIPYETTEFPQPEDCPKENSE